MPIGYVGWFARLPRRHRILVEVALLCADDVGLRRDSSAEPESVAGAAERFPTFWCPDRRGWTGSLAAEAASGPPHDFPLFAHCLVSLACSAFDPLRGSHPKINRPSHSPVDEEFVKQRHSGMAGFAALIVPVPLPLDAPERPVHGAEAPAAVTRP